MTTYALTTYGCVVRDDGAHIPCDPANSDYAAYLDWVAAGGVPTPVPVPGLADIKQTLSDDIDAQVATAYSSWTRFQAEYQAREAAASAFKAAGYTGDPGIYVTGFATVSGNTNQQAADLILSQAAALNGALAAIGAQRMRKYEILAAADAAAAQSVHDNIIAQIAAILSQVS
jgi:hypothetical protein